MLRLRPRRVDGILNCGRSRGEDGKFSRPPSTALRLHSSAERNHLSGKKHKASRPWGNDAGIEQLGKADFLFESGRLCSAMDILFLGGFAKVLIIRGFWASMCGV